jgi:hypothetical protein
MADREQILQVGALIRMGSGEAGSSDPVPRQATLRRTNRITPHVAKELDDG